LVSARISDRIGIQGKEETKEETKMENTGWLDLVAGGVAIAILIGGLAMLFSGVSSMNRK
jgi:hypothetical protein